MGDKAYQNQRPGISISLVCDKAPVKGAAGSGMDRHAGFGHVICPEHWALRNEIAPFNRLYYVLGGDVWYTSSDNRTVKLRKNTLYVLPAFRLYSMHHNADDPFEVIYFHVEVSPVLVDDIVEIEDDETVGLFIKLLETFSAAGDSGKVEKLCSLLVDYAMDEGYCHCVYDERLLKPVQFIDRNITSKITIEKLSELADLDRAYFSRLFKKIYGLSPMEYVLHKRISFACMEILKGRTGSQIAPEIGYCDEKSFSRSFRKVMGQSVERYRKSHLLLP